MAHISTLIILAFVVPNALSQGVLPQPPKSSKNPTVQKDKSDLNSDTSYVSIEKKPENNQADQTAVNKNTNNTIINIVNSKPNTTTELKNNANDVINVVKSPTIESGAVKRGVLVFVGISMIFMVYVAIKTYR